MSSCTWVIAQQRRDVMSGKNGETSVTTHWQRSRTTLSSIRASARTLRSSSINSAPATSKSWPMCAVESVVGDESKALRSTIDLRRKLDVRWLQCFISSLTPHNNKWTHPALTPTRQDGTWFTYPGGMEGWVDLGQCFSTFSAKWNPLQQFLIVHGTHVFCGGTPEARRAGTPDARRAKIRGREQGFMRGAASPQLKVWGVL